MKACPPPCTARRRRPRQKLAQGPRMHAAARQRQRAQRRARARQRRTQLRAARRRFHPTILERTVPWPRSAVAMGQRGERAPSHLGVHDADPVGPHAHGDAPGHAPGPHTAPGLERLHPDLSFVVTRGATASRSPATAEIAEDGLGSTLQARAGGVADHRVRRGSPGRARLRIRTPPGRQQGSWRRLIVGRALRRLPTRVVLGVAQARCRPSSARLTAGFQLVHKPARSYTTCCVSLCGRQDYKFRSRLSLTSCR
jgi:hypothetical protein